MKVYLVYVVLKNADKERLASFVTGLQDVMGQHSEIAFRSAAGDVFGFFMQTDKAAAQTRARIETMPSTINGDVIMVAEIGKDYAAIGNSRAWTWLQHRLPKEAA